MPEIGKKPIDKLCEKCGKKYDVYHMMEAKLMPILTTGSVLALIIGQKGSGKTYMSMWLACIITKFPHYNYHVISNVVFGKFKGMKAGQNQGDPEAIADFERASPPSSKMHFANNLVDVFRIESELLMESFKTGKRVHVLLIIDEGPVAVGGQATTSIYDPKTRAIYKLLTLTRKIQTSLCIITLHEKLIAAKLRTEEDVGGIGLVRVVFSKYLRTPPGGGDAPGIMDVVEMSRQGAAMGKYDYAYDISSVPKNQWQNRLVAVYVADDPEIYPSLLEVGTSDFTIPTDQLELDDVTFDTYSIAGFTLGEIGGKPFSLDDLINKLSDLHSNDIPQVLYDYVHPEGTGPIIPTEAEKEQIEEDQESVTPDEVTELSRRIGTDTKDAADLEKLMAEQARDKAYLKAKGKPLYQTRDLLRISAGVSVDQYNKLKHLVDWSYRDAQKEQKEDDAEEQV